MDRGKCCACCIMSPLTLSGDMNNGGLAQAYSQLNTDQASFCGRLR